MIKILTMADEEIFVNPDYIETMKATPDTVLVLNTGKRIIAKDSPERIVEKIVEYRRQYSYSFPFAEEKHLTK